MFQNPRVFVEEENGVETGRERGIDIALGAVSDHPAGVLGELVASDDGAVGWGIFLRDDFDCGEVFCESGAANLVGLLGVIAFCHQDEAVTLSEVAEGFIDLRQKFDLLLGDGIGEAYDAVALVLVHRFRAESFEARDKRAREAGQTVAVREDGFALDGVECLADFSGRVLVVVEVADEGGDGALEVDVVFPEGVVGVDEERLSAEEIGA